MLVTLRFAEPDPMVALSVVGPGPGEAHIPSKPLRTRPDADRRSTRALAQAGTRTATSPEIVATLSPPPSSRSMSAVTRPLTVLASSWRTAPPARVRSPETELNAISPSMSRASRSPDTVFASTLPITPSSVMSPDTLLADIFAEIPDTIALAFTTPTWVGQPPGTVTVTSAE